jgi:hypothetical protein
MEIAVTKVMVTMLVLASVGLAGCAVPVYSYTSPSYAYVAPATPYYYDAYGNLRYY